MFKAIIAAMCECSMIFLFFLTLSMSYFDMVERVWLVGGKGYRMDDPSS